MTNSKALSSFGHCARFTFDYLCNFLFPFFSSYLVTYIITLLYPLEIVQNKKICKIWWVWGISRYYCSSVISSNIFSILCSLLFLFFLLFCFWDLLTDLFEKKFPLNISAHMSSFFFKNSSMFFTLVLSTELSFSYQNSWHNLVLVSHFQCYTIRAILQYR